MYIVFLHLNHKEEPSNGKFTVDVSTGPVTITVDLVSDGEPTQAIEVVKAGIEEDTVK